MLCIVQFVYDVLHFFNIKKNPKDNLLMMYI